MQCIDKPGPVNSLLWQILHLKCLAFWCCTSIFSSSNSLLQYLQIFAKEHLHIYNWLLVLMFHSNHCLLNWNQTELLKLDTITAPGISVLMWI